MTNKFTQPDPNTCVPTAFAYLTFKEKELDFTKVLNSLLNESYKLFGDNLENGMGFEQLKEVAGICGFPCQITSNPPTGLYLTGVSRLPLFEFNVNELIDAAVKSGAVILTDKEFIYPFGHAITVLKAANGTSTIFDSLCGKEIQVRNLDDYLEKPISYLSLIAD